MTRTPRMLSSVVFGDVFGAASFVITCLIALLDLALPGTVRTDTLTISFTFFSSLEHLVAAVHQIMEFCPPR